MSWVAEYKKSLKSIEAEEFFDLLIFRPLSYILVKLIYNTGITPNQISTVSMLFGIAAGIAYGFGPAYFITGAVFYFICNTLDCVDGQLARLKQNGTKLGRVVDGFIDYISSISIYSGIAIALGNHTGDDLYWWLISAAAGISSAFQSFNFDFYRNLYLEYVYNKTFDINEEINEFREEQLRLKNVQGHYFEKFLISGYIKYTTLQEKTNKMKKLVISPELYKAKNLMLLKTWSWIGSTTHMTALFICTFAGRLHWYLYGWIIFGNIILIVTLLIQKHVNKELSEKHS